MSQVLYTDLAFPPNDSSLGPSLAATGLLTWRRPSQFPGVGQVTGAAFGCYGKPLPSDVRPCPFAADASLACALAALAERPLLVSAALCGRVEEAAAARPSACGDESDGGGGGRGVAGGVESGFRTGSGKSWEGRGRRAVSRQERAASAAAQASTAAARSGMFSARLCVGGVWKEYVLDDFFPCLSDVGGRAGGRGGPCLSRAHGPALWVSMIEKAYARAMGSYSAALKGCCLPSGDGTGVAGRRREVVEAGGSEAAPAPASVIARPAEVLGVLTGAPVLQVEIGGRGRESTDQEEVKASAEGVTEDDDGRDQVAEELWGSIVSWPSFKSWEIGG